MDRGIFYTCKYQENKIAGMPWSTLNTASNLVSATYTYCLQYRPRLRLRPFRLQFFSQVAEQPGMTIGPQVQVLPLPSCKVLLIPAKSPSFCPLFYSLA